MSKNTEDLNYTPNQVDTIDIYRTLHSIIIEYILFSKYTENIYHATRKTTSFPHPLQIWVAEAKFMISVTERLGAPFFFSTSSHRVEALLQVQQPEDTWAPTSPHL